MISIKDLIHKYAETLDKRWSTHDGEAHDRATTVGASEIGQCVRKTWFAKHDAPRDPDYKDGWGARERGNLIEEFWVRAIRSSLPETARLLYAGEDQRTLVKGYLSATTDGIIVSSDPAYCVNLDCKSIDPRVDLRKQKAEHEFQVQTQMGLIRELTPYRPEHSILSYINASFLDDVKEFVIEWNPRAYAAAQARAEAIMTENDPLRLRPEGKMSGGGECRYCPWASHCADVQVAGVPKNETAALSDDDSSVLHDLCEEYAAIEIEAVEYDEALVQKREEIKQFLRDHDIRRYKGDGWSVSYSVVAGRETLDIQAIEAAGIDLSPYYKTGKPSERLTVK